MPKDIRTHVDTVSRRDRTTLRELAHIRCHQTSLHSRSPMNIRMSQAPSWNRPPTPTNVTPPASIDVVMDNIESCLSSLSLDGTKECEQQIEDCEIEDIEVHGDSETPITMSNSGEATDPVESSGKRWSEHPRLRRAATLAEESLVSVHASDLGCEATLRRRISKLERRECGLKFQVRTQKRTIASLVEEAEGMRRLLVKAEEHFREYERTVERIKDESNRYCRWWLSESRDLKDLLGFVADTSNPRVSQIASESRARFVAFYEGR